MLEKGVYVVGFSYRWFPRARPAFRTQVSAGHTREDLDFAVKRFGEVKKEMASDCISAHGCKRRSRRDRPLSVRKS